MARAAFPQDQAAFAATKRNVIRRRLRGEGYGTVREPGQRLFHV